MIEGKASQESVASCGRNYKSRISSSFGMDFKKKKKRSQTQTETFVFKADHHSAGIEVTGLLFSSRITHSDSHLVSFCLLRSL
jgi:hypothetical protein